MVCIRLTDGEGGGGQEGREEFGFSGHGPKYLFIYFNTYNNYGQNGNILLLNIQQTTELSI